MDFYDVVTADNAMAWYEALPPHLKKQLDAPLDGLVKADVHAEYQKLDKDVSSDVTTVIGYDLPNHVKVNDSVDGNTVEECERFEKRKQWCAQYNEHLILLVILRMAPRMQKERKMLSQALGLKEGGNGFPAQTDGLDDVTAATVNWITSSGETPLEYLASVYRNDDGTVKVSERVNAARALMDFVHRKLPTKQEIETTNVPKVNPSLLKNLSPNELDLFESLIKKMDKE